MYKPIHAVEVHIWGKRVGAVALDPQLGYYAFEYDPPFLRTGIALSPLAMPLASAHQPFAFPTLPEATYHRLPALLADALPDDFGNALVNAWMAQNGVSKSMITPLDRLAYMGKRGIGALEFKPARSPALLKNSTALTLSNLVESARDAVSGNLAADSDAALSQIIQVGTSAGGARAKAVVAWNPKTQDIRPGQFEITPGFEHWLLKFDGVGTHATTSEPYGRIEYAYSRMAVAAGIHMTACHLLEENGRAHFMTKRFDREGHQKHHLQTLCAMAHMDYRQMATHDYAQLFMTIKALGLGYDALEDGFRRMVFNVMATNCDDHTKNTSFLYKEGGGWQLSPAYDITHAHNPQGKWTAKHAMSVNGKFTQITKDDMRAVADRFGIGRGVDIITHVQSVIQAWPDFAAEAKVPMSEVQRIQEGFSF